MYLTECCMFSKLRLFPAISEQLSIICLGSTVLCSSAAHRAGQCCPLSSQNWHSWMCTHMTLDDPAHDIFGFKMTSRQRGAQQAGRSSVKRSSRRRTSLLSSVMTSPHSPSVQLLWNNSQPPGFSSFASPLSFLSCTYFFFTLSNPSTALSTSRDVSR